MGIKGLWPEVRPICRQSHLSNFRGQRVAVDMYVWLHRGIIGSVQLSSSADAEAFVESVESSSEGFGAEGSVRLSTKFLQFVVNRVELMLRFGVHPVFVFDGAPIPMKRDTEKERESRRASRLAEALQILKSRSVSNPRARREAGELLEKGIDITTELAHAVIQVLQERRLECIVAPYEADAQLAYLCREGYVQAVISEDSDLIAYHCPCLIAKLDGHGNCEVLSARDLPQCQGFYGLTYESFLVGCILSGCDYLPSLRQIGVKKAFRLVAQATSVPSIMHNLQVKFGFSREELEDYESKLQQAFYCFAHHFVFDPVRKEVVHLTPLPAGVPLKTNVLGEAVPKDIAQKVCGECLFDPNTRALYQGIYQYCVQEYWQKSRGGQTSLKTFSGFHEMQSPRVILPSGQNNSDTQKVFSSPLQKVREATGFCVKRGGPATVVRSKYFTNGRWKVEDWEGDESESTPMGTLSTQTATSETNASAAGNATVSPEDGAGTSSEKFPDIRFAVKGPAGGQEGRDPLEETWSSSPLVASPGVALTPQTPTTSGVGDGQSQREKSGCPFGYSQCGRRHSIFELCFQGKNWSGDAISCGAEGTNDTVGSADSVNDSNNAGESSSTSSGGKLSQFLLQGNMGGKRVLESAAPSSLRRGFRPPASTSDVPVVASSRGDHMAPAAKRRVLSSTETALQLMSRFNSGDSKKTSSDLKTQDGSNGKATAAVFFKKLAYARQ